MCTYYCALALWEERCSVNHSTDAVTSAWFLLEVDDVCFVSVPLVADSGLLWLTDVWCSLSNVLQSWWSWKKSILIAYDLCLVIVCTKHGKMNRFFPEMSMKTKNCLSGTDVNTELQWLLATSKLKIVLRKDMDDELIGTWNSLGLVRIFMYQVIIWCWFKQLVLEQLRYSHLLSQNKILSHFWIIQ